MMCICNIEVFSCQRQQKVLLLLLLLLDRTWAYLHAELHIIWEHERPEAEAVRADGREQNAGHLQQAETTNIPADNNTIDWFNKHQQTVVLHRNGGPP
jgi:hypothetical protein